MYSSMILFMRFKLILFRDTKRKAGRNCSNFVRQALKQLEHMETSKIVVVILSLIYSGVITGHKFPALLPSPSTVKAAAFREEAWDHLDGCNIYVVESPVF